MNKFRILIIFLVAIILFSCEENENVNPDDNAESKYWPMRVGNYWTFVDSSYNSDSETWRVDTVTWYLSEEITIKGKDYYSMIVTNDYPEISNQNKWLFYTDDNNVISAGAIIGNDTLIAESILIKDTETIGESWPYYHVVHSESDGLYVRDTLDMSFDAIGELNNEIYGLLEYGIYSYSFNVQEDIRTTAFFMTKDIGPIRIVGKENDKLITISELIDYKLK